MIAYICRNNRNRVYFVATENGDMPLYDKTSGVYYGDVNNHILFCICIATIQTKKGSGISWVIINHFGNVIDKLISKSSNYDNKWTDIKKNEIIKVEIEPFKLTYGQETLLQ